MGWGNILVDSMRLLRTLVLTLFVLPSALAAPQNSQTSLPVLPTVTAYALDRAKVTLPRDFRAPLNLLILSFQRDQQGMVDGWIKAVPGPRVETWWLPVSARENGVYRWWLNASLRGSLAASQPRHCTVPLYVNKPQFLKSLQISSEQDVVVLLTDKSGRVLWRTAGAENDSKKAELSNFLTH
jgi:hypothetical protein